MELRKQREEAAAKNPGKLVRILEQSVVLFACMPVYGSVPFFDRSIVAVYSERSFCDIVGK